MAMGEKITVGDYGEISFVIRKKRKYPVPNESQYMDTGFVLVGRVADVDSKNVLVIDNDDIEYLVSRSRIRAFSPMTEPQIITK